MNHSLLPPALRWAGPALALGYGIGGRIHRALSSPQRAPLPAICIGNITVGGTGKTPATKYFARGLAQRGRKPAVLMRGYKGQASDEGVEVQDALADLKIPVLIGADRLAGAQRAKEQGCDCVLLDDGFQHWKLARDLDIVLVDATDPFGGGHLAPWGKLRESPEGLARAGVVIVTRSDMVSPEELARIEKELARLAARSTQVKASHKALRMRSLIDGAVLSIEKLKGMKVSAMCGIGNPESFRRILEQHGALIRDFTAHDDHHEYNASDKFDPVPDLHTIVTEKDAVKLSKIITPEDRNIWCLEVSFAIVHGEEAVWSRIDEVLARQK